MPVGGGRGGYGGRKKFHLLAINPTATTHGYFVLSPVSLASRDQDELTWRPVELNDRHLQSHAKIGDCEQSIAQSPPTVLSQNTEIIWESDTIKSQLVKIRTP